jgi:hypothetical protein
MTFKLGARSQVCGYCRFVVVRTDRGLEKHGRIADLLELPSPLVVGHGGFWAGKRFEVEGRVQYDRVGAASAPWQEFLLGFPEDGSTCWVASAQGRWYATREVQALGAPSSDYLSPGATIDLGQHGAWVVQELGLRQLKSAEGNLTGIPKPDVVTRFADLSGPQGRFATLDYGDGSEPPQLFVGYQFNPAEIRLDSGAPLEAPTAQVKDVQCPTCGGNLPLLSERAERVVCQYCGTQSDLRQGHLQALGPTPRAPVEPLIPIGAEAVLRGVKVVCCGFVVRSCLVEGERYAWREYLLWAGPSAGYWWLMEEDGAWWLVTPLEPGDVADSELSATYRGESYSWKQRVTARVDHVVGEFYWKVTIGESVEATEFEGPGGKISRERAETEVTYSFCGGFSPQELASFGIQPPTGLAGGASSGATAGCGTVAVIVLVLLALVIVIALADCSDGGGGGGFYGGGTYSK